MGYGTPYLLSFGISKSVLTLAWLAGPLSGLLMQPLIGVLSDYSTSRYFLDSRPFFVIYTYIQS
jgi:solute carrier family 45, member 1/2/4